jgi:ribonucleoside-triphosphate reductase
MRTLEAIEKDLAAAREALSGVEGMPAEVYSRIVGYYRSVRNWNKGKREEYGERKLFEISTDDLVSPPKTNPLPESSSSKERKETEKSESTPDNRDFCVTGTCNGLPDTRLLLFVRNACPACPSAKAAAGRLGIPVDLVNADTADGLEKARRYQVYATPTAILFNGEGREVERAWDSQSIAALDRLAAV